MNKKEKAVILFVLLYIVWHFGRYYEFKQRKEPIYTAYFKEMPTKDDIFINTTSEIYLKGETVWGWCY